MDENGSNIFFTERSFRLCGVTFRMWFYVIHIVNYKGLSFVSVDRLSVHHYDGREYNLPYRTLSYCRVI